MVDLASRAPLPPITKAKSAGGDNALMLVFLLVAAVLSLLPILRVEIPPLLDYPNHYARLWLISGGAQDPVMAAMYRIDWGAAWTNVLTDMIAASVGPILPLQVLSRLLLALGLLMPAIGLTALNRALFGGLHWWNIVCMILVWNVIFLAGFLNFSIGLGLALLLAAGDLHLASRSLVLRLAYRAASSALLLIAHPFALLFFVLLQAAMAFGPHLSLLADRSLWKPMLGRVLAACTPCFIPLLVLLAFGPALPGSNSAAGQGGTVWSEISLTNAISVLLTYFKTYDLQVDAVYVVLFAGLIGLACLRRRLSAHAGLLLVAGLLAVVSPFIPVSYRATGAIDLRLPSMMVLALAAGVRLRLFEAGRDRLVLASLALVLVASRMIVVDRVWSEAEKNIAAVEAAVADLPPGAKLLPLQDTGDKALNSQAPSGRFLGRNMPLHWHYGSLAVVREKAFIPTLFTAAGKQPITVLPPYTEISVPEGVPPTVDLLTKPVQAAFPYLADWTHRFDYILVLNADQPNAAGPMTNLPNLVSVADKGFARLYRIAR
ncbi:hypothetical protein [Aureimonas sp. AU40]|uniref:hypothetical protein n=1 Tax=Aureimonas sp. AU40 TaxID=1637747 RepID=UPI0007844180|nr:hypothetical protein [Aureimonas sp. AU40]